LNHHLGCTPDWVNPWVSFDEFATTNGGSLAPAAGNQVLIEGADATTIHVANDSCVDYYLLVIAGANCASCP